MLGLSLFYKVKYSVPRGTIVEMVRFNKPFNGNLTLVQNLAEALSINPGQIISKTIDIGAISKIKDKHLPVILISLYSAALSGQNLTNTLSNILDRIYRNKNLNNKILFFKSQGLTVSNILERLHLHTAVVELTKVSEKTGNAAQAFDDANDFLSISESAKQASKTGIELSVLYFVLGLLLTFLSPYFLAGELNEVLGFFVKDGEKIESTTITYLNFMSDNVVTIMVIFVIIISLAVFSILNKRTYEHVKKLPIFKIFDKLLNIKKALIFMPFYSALKNDAGIKDKDIVSSFKRIDHDIAQNLLKQMNLGRSLPSSLANSNMPIELSVNISASIKIENIEARKKALNGYIKLLATEAVQEGKRLSIIFSMTGYILIGIGTMTLIMWFLQLHQLQT